MTADTEVFVSVTRDSRSGRVFVKLVNTTAAAAPVQIDTDGSEDDRRDSHGAHARRPIPQATNSIDAPRNVVPVGSKLTGVKSGFDRHRPGERDCRPDAGDALRASCGDEGVQTPNGSPLETGLHPDMRLSVQRGNCAVQRGSERPFHRDARQVVEEVDRDALPPRQRVVGGEHNDDSLVQQINDSEPVRVERSAQER